MHKLDLTMEHITKVEGNASLRIKVEEGKVVYVKFAIDEYKRFFTEAMRGKAVAAIPQHLARICGTCSNAHVMCSIEACENALDIEPSEQTKVLRSLAIHGLIIRDHALHLYLFSLPDLYNVDAFLDLDENNPEHHQILHDGFDTKSAGNYLATLIAGRSVHANYPVIGGFLHFPDGAGVEEAIEKLKSVRPAALRLIEIFRKAPFHFDRKTKFMALVPDGNFGYTGGSIVTSKDEEFSRADFRSHLEHVVLPYSQASAYSYQGEDYMVGSLARLNLAKDKLNAKTKESIKEVLDLFPSTDIFYNNLAQAIEILHSIDESIEILTKSDFKPEPIVKGPAFSETKNDADQNSSETVISASLKPANNDSGNSADYTGIGVIEAPRGTLYHKVVIGKDGIVKEGEVVVPTGQNQINIERDIGVLVNSLIENPEYAEDTPENKEKIAHEIEKLIRAYDPCMSCATHFLKVEWI